MSQFDFLQQEWPGLFDEASKAEALAYPDARTACFHARRALEVTIHGLYKYDATLKLPNQDNLSALIHEPTLKAAAGAAVFTKMVLINRLGNAAVHGHRPVPQADAVTAVRELFHVAYWLAHSCARGAKPTPGLAFDLNALPKTTPLPKRTMEQLQRLETDLRDGDEKLSALLTATPRDEIDRDNYGLFDLERGVPPDAYDLSDAVADKFLVPSKVVSVPLKFQREGIKYENLSEEEKEQWNAKEWNDDGITPDFVEPDAVNK